MGHKTLICGQVERSCVALFPSRQCQTAAHASVCLYVSRSLFLLTRVVSAFCRPEGEPDTYPELPREEPLRGSAVVARGAEMWQGPPACHLNRAVAPSQGRGGRRLRLSEGSGDRCSWNRAQVSGCCWRNCRGSGSARFSALLTFSPRSVSELSETGTKSQADGWYTGGTSPWASRT